jgi:hypothetical protein
MNSKHIKAKHNTENETIKDTTTANIETIQKTPTIQQQKKNLNMLRKVKYARKSYPY